MLQHGDNEQEERLPLQPLGVGLEDKRLLKYLNSLEKSAQAHWNASGPKGINLKERRKQNLKYLYGRQLLGRDLKEYESELIDNVIYEFEGMLKSLAVSKMPDISVGPGGAQATDAKKKTAELLTKANENRMFDRKFRKNVGILFKHLPVYFTAIYKYRWDESKGKYGDIVEEVRNPENIILDHTAVSSDPDDMLFIIDKVSKTAKQWAAIFPQKEEEIEEYVEKKYPNIEAVGDEAKKDWLMAQKIETCEVWFDWFDKAEDFDVEKPSFDNMVGVAWKMGDDLMLDSMKNPNWDYEGHQIATIEGEPVDPQLLAQFGDIPGLEVETLYNNYFEAPKKPYIILGFDQFLRSAIDETSRIEQNIPLQKSMDDVERQIDSMIKNHRGKHVWGSESGMIKKDLKKLDMNDPNKDILAKGDPSKVHKFIQPVMPTPETFVHVRDRRERQFAKAGVHGATRGEIQTSTATTNQIAREADFTKSDDIFDETILHVTAEMAKARLHMMKLRYKPEHWKKLLGMQEGEYVELRLDNDSIEDGMEVLVKASTTDKLRAERNAQAMMNAGYSDPLSFYEDMGIPNAQERAERLFLKDTNPSLYYQKFILKKDISQLAEEVIAKSLPQPNPDAQFQPPQVEGGLPAPSTTPSPAQPEQIPQNTQGSPRGIIGGIRNAIGI